MLISRKILFHVLFHVSKKCVPHTLPMEFSSLARFQQFLREGEREWLWDLCSQPCPITWDCSYIYIIHTHIYIYNMHMHDPPLGARCESRSLKNVLQVWRSVNCQRLTRLDLSHPTHPCKIRHTFHAHVCRVGLLEWTSTSLWKGVVKRYGCALNFHGGSFRDILFSGTVDATLPIET